ncbi:Kojic acid related protein [Sphaerulina musiva]
MIILAKQWRMPKFFVVLLLVELPLTVAMLTLMGIAHPNTYRTRLWQNGFDKGFNSAPNSILYDYANWRPAHVPEIWSHGMTEFNVVISILSMFLLLAKSTMFVMHIFIPGLSSLVHAVLVALYAVSVYNQSRPDMSDINHLSPGMPWYLSKGCDYATAGNRGFCLQARASFGVTIVMLALFVVYLGYSAWSSIPTPQERLEREADRRSDLEMKKLSMYGLDDDLTKEERREHNRQLFLNLPKTPSFGGANNPMTPRTMAFTQLNGGEAPPMVNVSHAGPSRALPFRDFHHGSTAVPDAR